MPTVTPLLEANNIGIAVAGKCIIHDISLQIQAGEIITLIGPNGAGKTTLIRALLGLVPLTTGRIKKHADLRIGYMPQKLLLSDTLPLTVERFLSLSKQASPSSRKTICQKLNIDYLLDTDIQRLSGGEHQRVLLAKALLNSPDILVLDEPAQGVDVTGQAELYQLISDIRDQQNISVLMVSHDLHLVMSSTDKVFCINQHICCSGHPDTVSQHPAYLELFGVPRSDNLAIYTHHHDHTHDNPSQHSEHNRG